MQQTIDPCWDDALLQRKLPYHPWSLVQIWSPGVRLPAALAAALAEGPKLALTRERHVVGWCSLPVKLVKDELGLGQGARAPPVTLPAEQALPLDLSRPHNQLKLNIHKGVSESNAQNCFFNPYEVMNYVFNRSLLISRGFWKHIYIYISTYWQTSCDLAWSSPRYRVGKLSSGSTSMPAQTFMQFVLWVMSQTY